MLCRQQRELADVELSRLSAEVQASAAAAADAQGLLAAAESTARRQVEAARQAQLKVNKGDAQDTDGPFVWVAGCPDSTPIFPPLTSSHCTLPFINHTARMPLYTWGSSSGRCAGSAVQPLNRQHAGRSRLHAKHSSR
jgi:hypothetical protein